MICSRTCKSMTIAAAMATAPSWGVAAIATAPSSPGSRVEAANRAATREPNAQTFANAVQIHPWAEGAVYRLYTAPTRVSEIALQQGETVISVAAGDTARWIIGDTTSGEGATLRSHILVKPAAEGLATNLVITTSRRVYHLEMLSSARTAMASLAWRYPEDELIALKQAAAVKEAAVPVAAGVQIDALNFNYEITGDRPEWRPLRAFDDGRRLYIEFPSDRVRTELPPLFATGPAGRPELVNYRLSGRYYVVDRLLHAFELRLGQDKQQVVRIFREQPNGAPRRKGRRS